MPSYKLDLSWDGTNYCGWQFQPNALSIQEAVEKIKDGSITDFRFDIESCVFVNVRK